VAALTAGASAWAVSSTRSLESEAGRSNQVRAAELNRTLERRRAQAVGLAVASGVAATGGLLLWFWPSAPVQPAVGAAPGQPMVLGATGRF
jgi:ferric-dicitrate binding protein FerR (iron transport regulator)